MTFAARLLAATQRAGTCLCVGIDPWVERLPAGPGSPADRAEAFGLAVVEAAAGRVAAVKPQFAFFEALGPAGVAALARVNAAARAAGLVVIGDAKRGDIGSTATAYAAAILGADAPFRCDAVTVNPFLGPDTVEPFFARAELVGGGVFVLLRTSNPGSARWQLPVAPDLAAWLGEAARQRGPGLGVVGAVVGATKPEELAALRAALPDVWFLVPGFGAQGASAADARRALRPDGTGALIVSARGATFPAAPDVHFDRAPAAWIADRIDRVREELGC